MSRGILFLGLGLATGCPTTFECDENTACGFGETCQGGVCVETRCASSAQCPMESYCLNGECLPGCAQDDDCYPGSSCDLDLRTCAEDACVDTEVDCGYREFCNTATGDCYDAGEQYCKFCDEDSECGEGNYCYGHYCGVDCSDGQECPGGFECFPFTDDVGNIVAYQCWTYCWLYEDVEPGAELSVAPPEPKHPIPTPPKGENPDLRTLWNVSP